MSRFDALLTRPARRKPPTAREVWIAELEEKYGRPMTERDISALLQGFGVPKPRQQCVRPTGPSIHPNQFGLSRTAVILFDAAKSRGGTLDLKSYPRRELNVDDRQKVLYVEELANYGLASLGPGPSLVIVPGFETALVASSWDDRP